MTMINRYCTVIGYFPVSFILVFKGRHVGCNKRIATVERQRALINIFL